MNKLISDMNSIGIIIDNPILDGKIHRVSVDGKKSYKKNGWYKGYLFENRIFCKYGRWDTGETISFKQNGDNISEEHKEFIKKITEKENKKQIQLIENAKIVAKKIYDISNKPNGHKYIENKKIKYCGIEKQYKDLLIIPIYDELEDLVNIQKIYENGDKRFLFGGKIKGCGTKINGSKKICICEGFATAASIFEATGYTVIIAFSANNIPNIAKIIKDKYLKDEIIICGDNDNGLKYAKIASENINAKLCYPDIEGYDFNDIAILYGIEKVKSIIDNLKQYSIITFEDIKSDNLTLNIDKILYEIPGLILKGLEACDIAGIPNIIQYNFPVVISIISRAIASKICCQSIYPSIYNIKIGGTSTGKTDVDKIFKTAIINKNIERFYGSTDFSSGPGLMRNMMDGNEQTLIVIDEITYLFKRANEDINGASKMSALLELYTAAGNEIKRSYSDKSNNIYLKNPVLILIGNATPNIFDDIKIEDLTSGLIQRIDFWCYEGDIPYRKLYNENNKAMDEFINGIVDILISIPPLEKHNLNGLLKNYNLKLDKKSEKRLLSFSKEIIDIANSKEDDAIKGIISRRYQLSIIYALIHAASTKYNKNLYEPLNINDLEWGILISDMLATWKINKLISKVVAGNFHRDCEIFKDAIKASIKLNLKPTLKILCNRRKRLKELKPRDIEDIIKTLINRGEIIFENDIFSLIK